MLSVEDQKIYSIVSANMARLTKIFKFYLDKECFTFDPEGLEKLRAEQSEKEEQIKKEMISAIREAIKAEEPVFSADLDLAKRVFDIVPAWDREEWETVETTAETICTNPAIVIEYLLNIIEN